MKKYISNKLKKNILKRLTSGVTAAALILYALPVAEIGSEVRKLNFSWLTALADSTEAEPPTNYQFLHDENRTISLTIAQFFAYAESYASYPAYHQYDKIYIKTSTDATEYFTYNFAGLGTSAKPFAGSITVESGKELVFNLDGPLFNNVLDTVSLNGNTGIKISRFYGNERPINISSNDTTPLIAKTVESGSGDKASWKVDIVRPSANDGGTLRELKPFGGMIGTMKANSELTLNVTMDQQTDDTSAIEIKSDSKLGLACGCMESGSKLDFTIGASSNGTLRNVSSISTSSGDVGGIVGEMEVGSELTFTGSNIQSDSTDIKTSKNGFAGGIVGKVNSATVILSNTPYSITQNVSGTNGVGAVYGYYKPQASETSIDLTKYSLNGQVNNTGSANVGGLFGELVCDHSFAINTAVTIKSVHQSGTAASYGGLIGKYSNTALGNTLSIGAVTTEMHNNSGKGTYYGGAVGIADDTAADYISFDGFTVDTAYNANALTFGGLVASAKKSFIDANDVTIKVDGNFYGGGLVGNLGNGILRMKGTTDLTSAKSVSPTQDAYKYGQIVGARDNALIFAEPSAPGTAWKLKRSEAVTADDIGGWGEVIRFNKTESRTDEDEDPSVTYTDELFDDGDSDTEDVVITINETAHTAVIESPVYEISTAADFAKTALNIQLSTNALITRGGAVSSDLSLSANIDLSDTGFTGFTRDNQTSNKLDEPDPHCVFSNSFYPGDYKVTLAIGEPYGYRGNINLSTASSRANGDGRIYNHLYNGLFGIMQGSDSTVVGEEDADPKAVIDGSCCISPYANTVYVGALAAIVKGRAVIHSMDIQTEFECGGNQNVYLGRLVGEINQPVSNSDEGEKEILITNCETSGKVSGANSSSGTCIGGVAGKIYHTANVEQEWAFQNIEITGILENTAAKTEQKIGGLIANISGYSSATSFPARTLVLNNITTSGLEIRGNQADSIGGMLGYQWLSTNVYVGYVDEDDDSNNTTVTIGIGSKVVASGAIKDMAGLVYNATGKWTVFDLDIEDITVTASSPRSFGMLINKGWYAEDSDYSNYKTSNSSSAIYLMLTSGDCYDITAASISTLGSADVFDELVAYSAYYRDDGSNRYGIDTDGDEYILKNGAGIVSIHIAPDEDSDDSYSNIVMDGTTASKTYQAKTALGAKPNPWTRYYYNLDTLVELDNNAGKLMCWGVNQYAHKSIKSEFPATFNFSTNTDKTCNLNGYSWYPVDVETNVSIKRCFFTFANKEFELSEAENGGDNDSVKSSLEPTQHYLMHAGLFRNVYSGKTVTLNSTTKLSGNVGRTDKYCGALICGKVEGDSNTSKANITINSLTLDKIYIHNIKEAVPPEPGNAEAEPVYQFVDYAPLVINKITKYTNLKAKDISTANYNSSLNYIQKDGTYPKTATSLIGAVGSETAKGISLEFSEIKLDGRTADVGSATQYGTERSIFTKATLLEKFEYEAGSGSRGSYTYTWADAWSSEKVTYGKEVGYTTEGEFPNIERIYYGEPDNTTARYANPTDNNDTDGSAIAPILKGSFLPYVYTPYNADGATHQLEVNHRSQNAEGCGTYNDPYVIKEFTHLDNIVKIINGSAGSGTEITLPTAAERTAYWCSDKTNKISHKVFTYDGSGSFTCEGETAVSAEDVRTYLASAYYVLGQDITLANTYDGISNFTTIYTSGTDQNNFAVFCGVIDGKGYTITNQSGNPLIVNSYGCVVKNLTVDVQPAANILRTQDNTTDKFPTCKSYGGLIGAVLGGDNIIDGVSVTYASMAKSFSIGGDNKLLIPVGGYIGVIVDGGVIFKDMSGKPQGLSTLPTPTSKLSQLTNDQYLYVNPIIGRVINGYAVTESTSYKYSEDDVTLHNGTKNYSIADIDPSLSKLSTSAYTAVSDTSGMFSTDVNIPNAQAMFIMSLLTQSSTTVGAPGTGGLTLGSSDSYDLGYKRMHRAVYSNIGTNSSQASVPDYTDALADTATSGVPYLVANYTDKTSGTSNYGVLAITNYSTVCNFVITGSDEDWYLPDGFRGIGSVGFNRENLNDRYISLHKFNGKLSSGTGEPVTIHMNMSLQHYQTSYDNYLPVSGSQGGFGLFNTLRHNRSDQGAIADDYKISDLNITGNITYFVFYSGANNGAMTYNKANVGSETHKTYLNTGGIAGYAGFEGNDSIKVETIGVSGLTVDGFETAGGFFGNLQLANHATNHQVTISNITADTAFTVKSKRYAGGIIGFFKQGNLTIDTVTITSPNVISYFIGSTATDFTNGAGGVIGFAQNSSNNKPIEITNITMGSLTSTDSNIIGYASEADYNANTKDTVAAGGIIGRSETSGKNGKSYSLLLKDCTINKISIFGHRIGGLIGTDGLDSNNKSPSYIEIANCHVKSPTTVSNRCTLYGKTVNTQHRACGGLVGGVNNNGVIIDNSSVEGYILQGYKDTAGVCAWVNAGQLTLRNVKVKDILLKSIYSGSLSGWTNVKIYGYNILCDNVQFQDNNGGTGKTADNGYLIGKAKSDIKLVGVSRKNATAEIGCFVPQNLAGTGGNAVNNSDSRYVIFADYLNAAEDSAKRSETFSNAGTGVTNVLDYDGNTVTDNKPYVSSSPKQDIGVNKFLTGDAMDANAFAQIIADKESQAAGYYQSAPKTPSLDSVVNGHLSTSKQEFGNTFLYNFPLLTVEDSDVTTVTGYINYYLQNLTNTGYDFSAANSPIYKVTLHGCTFSGNDFVINSSNDTGSLQIVTGGFKPKPNAIDNSDPNTPQFTLMDVQFYDPLSDKKKTAYHLYVPIYVKKLVEYRFSAKLASGTNYYTSAYSSIHDGNTMFENLGNPVTLKLEYTYERTAADWADAINDGENVLDGSNFYKALELSMSGNNWIPNSRLVLVDSLNNDKHYYYSRTGATMNGSTGKYQISFEDFTDNGNPVNALYSPGTPYSPAPMSRLFEVNCAAGNNTSPLIRIAKRSDSTAAQIAQATVEDKNGYLYRPRTTNDGAVTGYTASISNLRTEVYYLSFFTNKSSGNSNIYHYEIKSLERFEKHSETDTNWKPNKLIGTKPTVHFITGNLYTYDNEESLELDVTPRIAGHTEMDKSNNILTVTMISHIALTSVAKTAYIAENLSNNPDSTIYQTFLMNFDTTDADRVSKIGVDTSAIKNISLNKYNIYYGSIASGEADVTKEAIILNSKNDIENNMTSNYIELRNSVNLNKYLNNSAYDNSVTIEVQFALEYPEANLVKQFPQRKDQADTTIGAIVKGYSNISSVAENGAQSATTHRKDDTSKYYTTDIQSAKLSYSINKDMTSANGQYDSLGINPFDETTAKTNKGHIDSTALYSFVDITEPKDYIEFNLSLTCKKDGYDRTPLILNDYLENLKIVGSDTNNPLYNGTAVSDADVKADISADGKTLTVRAKKDKLIKSADKIYSINISYDVLTGASNGFGDTKAYSNYKVALTADMHDSINSVSSSDASTKASTHIIYTNSKLQYKMIS